MTPGSGISQKIFQAHSITIIWVKNTQFFVADPDPGSGASLTPGSGMEKNPDPGSAINIPYHISSPRTPSPFYNKGGVFSFFMYDSQHCFICRPSDSTVPEDAGIAKPGQFRQRHWLSVARSHPQSCRNVMKAVFRILPYLLGYSAYASQLLIYVTIKENKSNANQSC